VVCSSAVANPCCSKREYESAKEKQKQGKRTADRKNSLTWATDGIDPTVCALFLSLYGRFTTLEFFPQYSRPRPPTPHPHLNHVAHRCARHAVSLRKEAVAHKRN
jgi:hypothetical protein